MNNLFGLILCLYLGSTLGILLQIVKIKDKIQNIEDKLHNKDEIQSKNN